VAIAIAAKMVRLAALPPFRYHGVLPSTSVIGSALLDMPCSSCFSIMQKLISGIKIFVVFLPL
jgi:hypothetical protein